MESEPRRMHATVQHINLAADDDWHYFNPLLKCNELKGLATFVHEQESQGKCAGQLCWMLSSLLY